MRRKNEVVLILYIKVTKNNSKQHNLNAGHPF